MSSAAFRFKKKKKSMYKFKMRRSNLAVELRGKEGKKNLSVWVTQIPKRGQLCDRLQRKPMLAC